MVWIKSQKRFKVQTEINECAVNIHVSFFFINVLAGGNVIRERIVWMSWQRCSRQMWNNRSWTGHSSIYRWASMMWKSNQGNGEGRRFFKLQPSVKPGLRAPSQHGQGLREPAWPSSSAPRIHHVCLMIVCIFTFNINHLRDTRCLICDTGLFVFKHLLSI